MKQNQSNASEKALSPVVLVQIVAYYGAQPDLSSVNTRYPLSDCPATALPMQSGDKSMAIRIVDLAIEGLGFTAAAPLPVGSDLVIEFFCPGIQHQLWSCSVERVDAAENGRYRIGARFKLGQEVIATQ